MAAPEEALTFVFTDIEGSTRLLERLSAAYADVLGTHAAIVRDLAARHHGREVDTQGDAFFLVFPDAADAVRMTAALQLALAGHPWPEGVAVRLRIGVHAGRAIATRTGYVGMDVHHAARVAGAAHGGQVLASGAVARSLGDVTGAAAGDPDPVPPLRPLGAYNLKDIREPVELLQVEVPGLPSDFPPPRTQDEPDEPPAAGEPPYPGLVPFEEADAARFFGRDALVRSLVERLGAGRFLAVVGASGSGKSSLVRAGLIPALRAQAPDTAGVAVEAGPRSIALLTPTDHPLAALDAALAGTGGHHPWAVVVDQLEELFTLCRDEAARTAFTDRLLGLLDGGARVVVALRADRYDRLASHARLRTLVAEHQAYPGPLGPDELRAAVEGPAAAGGWRIAPGLTDLVVHDVGAEPGALPLLAHALRETWERRRGTRMVLRGYLDAGGVRGAIARTADRLLADLGPGGADLARAILLRLAEPGDDAPDTRRRAPLAELASIGPDPAATRAVLDRLVAARLVVTDERTAEVAHEALIREWPTFRGWLDADRDALRLHRAVTDGAADWERAGRDASLLFRGARLAAAAAWLADHGGDATDPERAFLAASAAEADRERAEREAARQRELDAAVALAASERGRADVQARAARRIRRAAAALVGLLVVAIGAAGLAFVQTQQADRSAGEARDQAAIAEEQRIEAQTQRAEAETQATIALGRQLVAQSQASRGDLDRSLLLALEGVARDGSGEAVENLASALGSAGEIMSLRFPENGAGALAASPDGSLVAVVGRTDDGDLLRVHRTDDWSVVLGPIPASVNHSFLNGYGPYGENLAFDAGGTRLVFATPDALGILDLATGAVTPVPETPGFGLDSVAWRRSDGRLAWIGHDDFAGHPVARILDPDGVTVHSTTLVPGFSVADDAYPYPGFLAPGGRWAITSDGTHAQLFDAETGAALGRFPDGEATIVGFAPDGGAVAMQGPEGVVIRTLPDLAAAGAPIAVTGPVFLAEPDLGAGRVRIWTDGRSMLTHDLATGRQLSDGDPVNGAIVKMAVSDHLRFVARLRSQDTVIEVVDPTRVARLQLGPPTTIDPDHVLAADSYPLSLISGDGSAVALWPQPEGGPSRRVLVTDTSGSGVVTEVRPDEASGIAAVALTPDGRAVITLHDSGRLIRTDWADGRAEDLGRFAPADPDMAGLVAGPDGLVAQMGQHIRLFGPDGERIIEVVGWQGEFLPDGRALFVADCDAGVIRRIDLATDSVAFERFLGGCPWDMDISPDGRRLLVGDMSDDRPVVQQLSVADGSSLGSIPLPSWLGSPRYEDPTMGTTVIGVEDGALVRYQVDPAALRVLACATAGRNLTRAEWSLALPTEPYHATCADAPAEDPGAVLDASPGPDAPATAGPSFPVPSLAAPGSASPGSASPKASPATAAVLCHSSYRRCWQPPGRLVLPVEPPLSVDVDGSWYPIGFEHERSPDGLTFAHDPGKTVDLVLGIRDLLGEDGSSIPIDASPEAFVEQLREDPRLAVGDVATTTLAGQPAISIDVTAASDADVIRYSASERAYGVAAGDRVRFIASVVDGRLVVAAAAAPAEAFPAFWEDDAAPMVGSLEAAPAP